LSLCSTLLLLPLGFGSPVLEAAILFQQSYTGQQLSALDGTETQFNITPTNGTGNSIELDPTGNEQILFSWDLLTAAPREELQVEVAIDYTPLSADNDPVFLISDGSVGVGLVRLDSGVFHAQKYSDNGTTIGSRTQTSNVLTGVGAVDPFSFQLTLADSATASILTDITEGANSTPGGTSIVYTAALDTDQALSFLMASSSVASSELYQLNAVDITITAIPEPMQTSICMGFLVLLSGYILRRKFN
jgi:hypothetical protein